MTVKTKAPKPLIKAASIATVLEKGTNKILGFLVKSNRTEDYYHIQTEIIGGQREFLCDCEAKDWGCDECCHIRAVKEVLVAKAELAQEEALLAEIETVLQAEHEQELAQAEQKEIALERKVNAVLKMNEYRRELENSPWNSPLIVTSNLKRAPQLKTLPLNGNAGFSLLKVS